MLTMLLKAEASPNLRASWDYNATPLIKAASLGEPDVVAILLAAGAEVNATNKIGQTALHLAKNAEVARLLIAAGADQAARAADGQTPASRTVREGYPDGLVLFTNALRQTNATEKKAAN